MQSVDIRTAFLEYFKARGHTIVQSSPLLPRHDPTLLFVNAGMVQFKSTFLGEEKRPYSRAVSCQKCMRAGGKHSDIENVGHTARHHTFFEMLGNFSFGDYFKKDAMLFAWQLLTEQLGLPKDKLHVSVYEEDDEAAQLWSEFIGIPGEKIVRLGAKDNFWQMGDTGPCGPCSEIIIDQGEDFGCRKPDCIVGCDCDRYLELWNLVFMQFNRDESGTLTPLPKPSIDTGMGLERITAVLQQKKTNFDSDIFAPIISSIQVFSGIGYGQDPQRDISIKVIADHIRAIAFLLCEGLTPSNEGRGYVLRRVTRRASRHAKLLGIEGPFLHRLIDSVTDVMGSVYPELIHEKERASKVLLFEEERFARTLEQGVRMLDEIMEGVKSSGSTSIPGGDLFRLYDTFGFPLDLARDMAMDNGLVIDEEGFNNAMEIQRERARASWVGEEEAVAAIYRELESETGKSDFIGYDTLESECTIKAIIKDKKVIKEAHGGEIVELILDRTPFYGESGGQVGDTGTLSNNTVEALVVNTKKEAGLHAHVAEIRQGRINVWDTVHCLVDDRKRMATARNHTATHLLHAALRTVLGDHVKQAGSYVSSERLRFDFSHFYQMEKKEIEAIEDYVNEKILENIQVKTDVTDIKDALRSGVIALFGEKYGERVRVIKVPGVSAELCGGTHCSSTGQIGIFVILSEGSVASGIRRIEALTGKAAFQYLRQKNSELDLLKNVLKTDSPIERVEKLISDSKSLEKEIQKLKTCSPGDTIANALKEAYDLNGVKIIKIRQDGLSVNELRLFADNVRDRLKSGVIVATSVNNGQAAILCMVTKDLTNHYNAGLIVKNISALAGGKGGGKPELAQGGTKDIDRLNSALESLYDLVRKTRDQ
ncbi:MAG: alaS [Nitrospirae bacterium]|nr:alaS [Nitrospirota bacterium]